jgi:serine/threonine protein kinase
MKFGSFSILLNEYEYNQFGIKYNTSCLVSPLLKITYINDVNIGDIKYIDFLIKKNDYIVKICKESKLIDINNNKLLIKFLKDGVKKYDEYKINKIFSNNLTSKLNLNGYFLEYLGDYDLFDSLTDLITLQNNIWITNTNSNINEFMIHMFEALEYLKENNIVHLDIKPENIIYNNTKTFIPFGKRFKLVDFGFADSYPFERYSHKICGSTDYIPYNSTKKKSNKWYINNNPNDWLFNPIQKKYIHYIYRYNAKPELIYKTDVYSMGVVFNQLIYYINIYMEKSEYALIRDNNIINLINNMTHKDIVKRFYASDCIKYINGDLPPNAVHSSDSSNLYNKIFSCCKK